MYFDLCFVYLCVSICLSLFWFWLTLFVFLGFSSCSCAFACLYLCLGDYWLLVFLCLYMPYVTMDRLDPEFTGLWSAIL